MSRKAVLLLVTVLLPFAIKADFADVQVGTYGLSFYPSSITVLTGTTVRWTWMASRHSVVSAQAPSTNCVANGLFCSPNNFNCSYAPSNNQGYVYTYTFTQSGTYEYFCGIHCAQAKMVGEVIVVDSVVATTTTSTTTTTGAVSTTTTTTTSTTTTTTSTTSFATTTTTGGNAGPRTLPVTYVANYCNIDIGGQPVNAMLWNCTYVNPVIRVRPGDTLVMSMINSMTNFTTNVHWHGTNVSPKTDSDSSFVSITPSTTFTYSVYFPTTHPPGLFWFHSHDMMKDAEYQILNGLAGGLIVEGLLDPFPTLAGINEQILLLKDIQIVDGQTPGVSAISSSAPTLRTVDGAVNPTFWIQPGETQLWRVANLSPDISYNITIAGLTMNEIAMDGQRHVHLAPLTSKYLAAAARFEFLLQGPPAGTYLVFTEQYSTGPSGDTFPRTQLATLISQGTQEVPINLQLLSGFPTLTDLRTSNITGVRNFTFSDSAISNQFFINGKVFQENRTDVVVQLGSIETWTIYNMAQQLHVFHIHQIDFQVIEISGQGSVSFNGYQDTVPVPYADESGNPGYVVIIVPFTNPLLVEGKFLFHCHILNHEDNGMMAVIQVVSPPSQTTEASTASSSFGVVSLWCIALILAALLFA